MVDRERDSESADLFDGQKLRDWASFVVGALRRRARLALAVFTLVVGGTVLALVTLPQTYRVECKVLAQRNATLAVRGDGPGADAPTRAAAETVLRRDNLVGLIHQTDLIRAWEARRAPAMRVKDAIVRVLRPAETEQDKIDWMVELLEKRLAVWTTDGTVTMAIDWPDAQTAYRLMEAAQQNFLEARHIQEVAAAAESVSILQHHAEGMRRDVDLAVDALQKLKDDRDAALRPPPKSGSDEKRREAAPRPAPRATAQPTRSSPELDPIRVAIDAKQRAIADLEDFRRRRLSELQARLLEQKATYTDNHPAIVDLQQSIAALGRDSPQVSTLKKELVDLNAEYTSKAAELARATPDAPPPPPPAARAADVTTRPPQLSDDVLRLDREPREERDPAMLYALGQLREAMSKYSALRTQIENAQIDLETAEVAFKYRYSVTMPAKLPKKPVKPNAPVVLVASFLAAAAGALLAAVVAELRSGKLVEKWQVGRALGLPLLAELDLSPRKKDEPA